MSRLLTEWTKKELREEVKSLRTQLTALREAGTDLRNALECVQEWAKPSHILKFDDGDIAVQEFCANAIYRWHQSIAAPMGREGANRSASLMFQDIPLEIIEAVQKVDCWMQMNGHEDYEIGPIASRKLVAKLRAATPPVSGKDKEGES